MTDVFVTQSYPLQLNKIQITLLVLSLDRKSSTLVASQSNYKYGTQQAKKDLDLSQEVTTEGQQGPYLSMISQVVKHTMHSQNG